MNPEGVSSGSPPPSGSGGRGLTHLTLSGLFWMFFSTGAQAGLQLLVVAILARLLSPAEVGVVSAALIVVGFSSIFSQLGVGPAIVQRPDLQESHLRTGFTLSLLFGALVTGAIWACAPLTALFFHMPELTQVVRVLSFVFVLQGLSMIAESLVQRELKFRLLGTIEVMSFAIGYGAVGVALAWLGYGIWSLVMAQLAQAALKSIALLMVESHPKRPMMNRTALTDLLYFGGGFTAARIGNYIAGQVDNLVVGRWLGAEALGIYNRAYQLMTAPANLFGQVLDRVLFPAMVKIQDSSDRLSLAYRRGVALIALIILPSSAVLFVLAPELIHVVLGPKWMAVVVPFQILAVGMIFRTSYKMSDSMARATGSVYRRAWRQAIYAILVAAGAWAGLRWGLPGVAWGVLAAITINFLLMAQLSTRIAGITWGSILAAHRPAFALTVILGGEAWVVRRFMLGAGWPPALVLAGTGGAVALTAALLILALPRLMVGEDGMWMLKTLSGYLPGRRGGGPRGQGPVPAWKGPQERGSLP